MLFFHAQPCASPRMEAAAAARAGTRVIRVTRLPLVFLPHCVQNIGVDFQRPCIHVAFCLCARVLNAQRFDAGRSYSVAWEERYGSSCLPLFWACCCETEAAQLLQVSWGLSPGRENAGHPPSHPAPILSRPVQGRGRPPANVLAWAHPYDNSTSPLIQQDSSRRRACARGYPGTDGCTLRACT